MGCTIPLTSCTQDGKRGWKWGDSGHCYNKGSEGENKRKAILQGVSYEGSHKVNKMLKGEAALKDFGGYEGLKIAREIMRDKCPSGYTDVFLDAVKRVLSKAEDGSWDYDQDKGDLLDNNPKAASPKEVDNAGDLSGNPKDTGDGMGNAKADPQDNNNAQLEKDRKLAGMNVVIPPYNDDAAPEQNPADKPADGVYQTPPTKDESRPQSLANETVPSGEAEATDDLDMEAVADDDDQSSYAAKFVFAYISQEERNQVPENDFAGPHQSFPIRNQDDVHHAATLIGHSADPIATKKKIIQIAKRKGLSLPKSWQSEADAAVEPEERAGNDEADEGVPEETKRFGMGE